MQNIILDHKYKKIQEEKRLSKTSDNIYYNAITINNQSNAYIRAEYVDNRSSSIVQNPADYYCSIIRFKVPITSVPIMIFKDNYYFIQLSYGGVNYPIFLSYIPDGISTNNTQNVYTIQQFLDSMNKAIVDIYTLAATANPLDPNFPRNPNILGNPIIPEYIPYVTFDSVTNLFTFHAWSAWGNVNANGNGNPPPFKPPNPAIPQFFMNSNLFNLFLWQGFGDAVVPLPNDTTLMYFKDNKNNTDMKILTNPAVSPPAPATISVLFYNMIQEEPTTYLFNEVQSIVFVSNSLNTKSELIPNVGSSNIGDSGNSSDNLLNIIADFELLQETVIDRGYVQFFQNGPYKYIDLDTTNELRNIKINVYWTDKQLRLYPIYLAPGQLFSLKLMFKKKSIANSGK